METFEITKDMAWEQLLHMGTEEQTIRTVVAINGWTMQTLNDILYAEHGYQSFDQLLES